MSLRAKQDINLSAIVTLIALMAMPGCQKNEKSKEAATGTTENTTQVGEVNIATNTAETYPAGLNVTTFSTETTANDVDASVGTVAIESGSELTLTQSFALVADTAPTNECKPPVLSNPETDRIFSDAEVRRPLKQLNEDAVKRVRGDGDCLAPGVLEYLRVAVESAQSENLDGTECYRPDYGIIAPDFGNGEVCMVGFARNEIDKLGSYVELSKNIVEAMLCQARKNGKISEAGLENGASQDLTAELKSALAGKDQITVASAILSRTDNSDGSKVYTTTLDLTLSRPNRSISPKINIIHQPSDETSYKGVVNFEFPTRVSSGNSPGGDQEDQTTLVQMKRAISVSYDRKDDSVGKRVTYEMRSGIFHKDSVLFDSDGVLDYNTGSTFGTNPCGNDVGTYPNKTDGSLYARRFNHVEYDGYPEINVGKLGYWVNFGSNYNEHARGFIFDTRLVDKKLTGCGVAGANLNVSVRMAAREGKTLRPNGNFRPFCSGVESESGNVWQQCFEQNSEGKFVLDSGKTDDKEKGFDFKPVADLNDTLLKSPKKPALIDGRPPIDGCTTNNTLGQPGPGNVLPPPN